MSVRIKELLAQSILPQHNGVYDIGSSSLRWNNLYGQFISLQKAEEGKVNVYTHASGAGIDLISSNGIKNLLKLSATSEGGNIRFISRDHLNHWEMDAHDNHIFRLYWGRENEHPDGYKEDATYFTFNGSTGTIRANYFTGDLNGNATTSSRQLIHSITNTNMNDYHTQGWYYGYQGMTNAAVNTISTLEVITYSWDWVLQRQVDINDGTTYQRVFHSGTTWAPWVTMLSSANYSNYALPLSGGSLTGNVNINNKLFLKGDGEGGNVRYISKDGLNHWEMDANNNSQFRLYWGRQSGHPDGQKEAVSTFLFNGPERSISAAIFRGGLIDTWKQSVYSGHFYHHEYDDERTVYEHYYYPTSANANKASTAHLRVARTNGGYFSLIFAGNGDFTWAGNPVLTSNNYNSYALPLSGGKLTGDLLIGNNIRLYSDNEGGNIRLITPGDSKNLFELDTCNNNLRLYYSSNNGISVSSQWVFHPSGTFSTPKLSCGGQIFVTNGTVGNGTNPLDQSLVLYSTGTDGTLSTAPGLGVMIDGSNWSTLKFLANGSWHFYNSECSGHYPVYASTFYGDLSGSADQLDGYHASSFVLKTGATMTGALTINSRNTSGYLKLTEDNEGGTIQIVGPNATYIWEMDSYNDTTFRIFSRKAGTSTYKMFNFNATTGDLSATSFTGTLYGRASGIHASSPILAEAGESNAIQAIDNTYYFTSGTPIAHGLLGIRKALDFQWFNSHWRIGNLRSGSTESSGFGFSFTSDNSTHTLMSFINTRGCFWSKSLATSYYSGSNPNSIGATGMSGELYFQIIS